MTTQQAAVLLFDLALILILARLLGAVAKRLDQPPVIGEVLAGILVGPTLFNGVLANTLFPTDVRPFLTALASVGVAVFMFVVGLELDQTLLRGKGATAITVSLSSIVLPFGLGAALAFYLMRNHAAAQPLAFILFMGAAMSVTAFPVLARILTDRNMHRTTVGGLALACAAVDDALAWSLLAVVVTVARGRQSRAVAALLVPPYLVLMFCVVRPLLRRLVTARQSDGQLNVSILATVLAGLLLSGARPNGSGCTLSSARSCSASSCPGKAPSNCVKKSWNVLATSTRCYYYQSSSLSRD